MSLLFQSTIIAAAPPSPVRPAPNNATTICDPDTFALSIRSAELPNLFLKPAEHGELTPATGAFQPIGAWPLSPATLRKEGSSFGLPIALAMLQLKEQNRILGLDHFYLCGELALSGELRPVKGTLAIALKARNLRRVRLSTDVVTKGIDAKSALLRYNA